MEDLPRSSANSFVPTFFPSTVNATVPSIFPSLPLCNAVKMVTLSPAVALSCESQMLRGGNPETTSAKDTLGGRQKNAIANVTAIMMAPDLRSIPDTIYDILMMMNSTNSFLKFTLGFLTLISVSFVITFAVNSYTVAQDEQQQTAAAIQSMLEN